MATAPWWWPLLITVIGTPLLGALLYFFVPLLRVAKRLGIWLSISNPPWWVQNIFAALLVGGIVAVVSILWQERISDDQAKQATRLENLRFVRQLSSEPGIVARPFSGLDLQDQNLARLDLKGAQLDFANLRDAVLYMSDLSHTPTQYPSSLSWAHLENANLAGADLTGANLFSADLTSAALDGADLRDVWLMDANLTGATLDGADLTGAYLTGGPVAGSTGGLPGANLGGVHYDEKTKWPVGFKPPPPAPTP